MVSTMKLMIDTFWRSLVYCLHPRVILLSLLPLSVMVLFTGAMGYFFWESAVSQVRWFLESSGFINEIGAWLDSAGLGPLKAAWAPLIVVVIATPVIVVLCLLVVSLTVSPAIVNLVSQRSFNKLERLHGASFWGVLLWSLGSAMLAVLAMLACVPLWLIPPLALVLPPLIWGWLTYRVVAFDVLAAHASRQELKILLARHRFELMIMGVMAGYLGAAPSLIWSVGLMTLVMAPILLPVSIWLYVLIFIFFTLWFAHYCLTALEQLRKQRSILYSPVVVVVDTEVN